MEDGRNATIFDIAESVRSLEEMLSDDGAENDALRDAFIAAEGALDAKVENWVRYIKSVAAAAESSDLEAKRLKDRATRLEARARRATDTLISVLDFLKKPVVDTGAYKVTVYDAGSRTLWVTPDWESVPAWAITEQVTVKVDKAEIKRRIEAGEEFDFAHYEPAKRTMRVS